MFEPRGVETKEPMSMCNFFLDSLPDEASDKKKYYDFVLANARTLGIDDALSLIGQALDESSHFENLKRLIEKYHC